MCSQAVSTGPEGTGFSGILLICVGFAQQLREWKQSVVPSFASREIGSSKMNIAIRIMSVLLGGWMTMAQSVYAQELQTEFAFEARVSVDKPLVIGESAHGLRRVVPITGGTVKGPLLNGRVVPGGADWQFVRPDGVLEVMAKYTFESDDGVLILIENRGIRHASPAVMERLTKGEIVDSKEYYFRTTATFEAPKGSKYEGLNRAIFVGVAERKPDAAVIRFYRVK